MFKQGIAGAAVLAALVLAAPAQASLQLVQVADLGEAVSQVRVADLDGDRIDDFVMASQCGVTTLQGNRDGMWTTGTMVPPLVRLDGPAGPCSSAPSQVAVADVTGDGAMDVVYGQQEHSWLSVYAGRGDGTFAAATSQFTVPRPQGFVAGDLNGDGRADLIMRTYTTIEVLLATPGGFAAPASYGGFDAVRDIATGHTNAGGTLDVVASVEIAGRGRIVNLVGNGDGTLAGAQSAEAWAAGPGLLTARLRAGLDRDDIVSLGGVQTTLTGADGSLTLGRARIEEAWREGAPADFDGDGDLDVVTVGHRDRAAVSFHFGDGSGVLETVRRYDFAMLPALTGVQATDVNSDGHADVVAVGGSKLFFLRNFTSLENAAGPGMFGPVAVGATSAPYTFMARNSGIRPVPVTGVQVSGPAFVVVADGCSGRVVPVDGTCPVTIAFKPTAAGELGGSVSVEGGMASAGTILAGTGVLAPTVVPADKTAPTVTTKVAKQKLKTVLDRGLKLTTACSEACTVKASLRLKGREVAKGSTTGKALTLKLTAKGKKALKKARSAKFTLRLTATDAAGNTRTTTKTITVRR